MQLFYLQPSDLASFGSKLGSIIIESYGTVLYNSSGSDLTVILCCSAFYRKLNPCVFFQGTVKITSHQRRYFLGISWVLGLINLASLHHWSLVRTKDSQINIYSIETASNSFVNGAPALPQALSTFILVLHESAHFMSKSVSVSRDTSLALQEVQLFVADAVPITLAFVLQHTVSGVCGAASLISPQALRWIQPLPAINDGVCKACQSLLLVSPCLVSSHASSPPT